MLGNIHHRTVMAAQRRFMRGGATSRRKHPSAQGFTGRGPDDPNRLYGYFGTTAVPATLAALKAHAVYGDAGTGKPNNGASANDAAFATDIYVLIGDGKASWNGTAWVALG